MQALLSSFTLVAISEMGDKTQLLALMLAAKFKRPWIVMGGIFTATTLNHALAATAGHWVSLQLSPQILSVTLGVIFVAFGIWTLRPDELKESDHPSRFGPFWTTTFLFFLAEMGDKTQLATVALGARYDSPAWVTLGTTLGMMLSDGLAVFLGGRLSENAPMQWVRRIAASLFFLFGATAFWNAFHLIKTGN